MLGFQLGLFHHFHCTPKVIPNPFFQGVSLLPLMLLLPMLMLLLLLLLPMPLMLSTTLILGPPLAFLDIFPLRS